ncbi:ArnT family glycosyltransferase [Actinosynnema sp. NPDC059335]|uniref:ArnT family glycosyltransferase n=1 Tax=Actinosynnema sp. NPDC059335 TaxID=3346804 RepID=UPI00367236A5
MTTATPTASAPTAAAPPSGRNRTTPALVVLLVGTAVLYLWNLTASGWGNGYYAAATQAGAQSWTAWLFGGLDAGGVITVDKPPAALWVSGLFARVFGFSSWTVLAPQAVEGVLAVWLLYATVKRTSGAVAGLLAGAALAVTPVAVLMFRFNLPDALLVLLMVAGAYCTVRALERASARWLALAGVAIGFAFLAKMGQALLVLPAFAAAYLLAAPTSLPRRLLHLLGAGLAVVVSAGWFIALVELWPKESRPYIGGSANDSLWELAMGYNGLGRIFGGGRGAVAGGGNANIGFGGETGPGRLFGASMGGEISWLLAAALVGAVAGLWFTRKLPRTDRTRAALVLWLLWVLGNGVVFSFMTGITHPYYTVAVAPGVAALVGIAGRELWRGRRHLPARVALAAMVAAAGFWGFALLQRFGDWLPALRWVVAALTVLVATAIVMGVRRVAALALVTSVLPTAAFGVATAATPHAGSIPMSGPASYAGDGGMGGGPMGAVTSDELVGLLRATTGTWAAATVSAQGAAELSLASGRAVIGIGGWSGGDPAPTLEEFRQYVTDGRVGYFVTGGMGGGMRGEDAIGEWVAANYQARTIDGWTVYRLG